MKRIPKLISKYNFYSDKLHPSYSPPVLADKGIIGHTKNNPNDPSDKPIYRNFENNGHLNTMQDHNIARDVVVQRIGRMNEAIANGGIAPTDVAAVNAEKMDLEKQHQQHLDEHIRLVNEGNSGKPSNPTGRLRSLRSSMRGK